MSGWLFAILFAVMTGAALWFFARPQGGTGEMILAALLIGVAGYAWQGSPGLAGAPRAAVKAQGKVDEEMVNLRQSLGDKFSDASKYLVMSDGLARAGMTEDAANILSGSGLKQYPQDANLWLGLGNALVAHANGQLSPAAEYAFRRAIRLDPEGPAPRYFFGLALAQSGQFKQAKDLWTQLLASAPEGSAWKTDLENNLAMLDRAIAGEAPPMP